MICKLYQFRLFSPPPHQLQTRIRLGIPLRHRQALLETEQGNKIFLDYSSGSNCERTPGPKQKQNKKT